MLEATVPRCGTCGWHYVLPMVEYRVQIWLTRAWIVHAALLYYCLESSYAGWLPRMMSKTKHNFFSSSYCQTLLSLLIAYWHWMDTKLWLVWACVLARSLESPSIDRNCHHYHWIALAPAPRAGHHPLHWARKCSPELSWSPAASPWPQAQGKSLCTTLPIEQYSLRKGYRKGEFGSGKSARSSHLQIKLPDFLQIN